MTAKPRLKLNRDALRVPIDLKTLGPAMRKLPSDRWRAAAVARFMVKPGRTGGGNTAACRVAGFVEGTTPDSMKVTALEFFMIHGCLRLCMNSAGSFCAAVCRTQSPLCMRSWATKGTKTTEGRAGHHQLRPSGTDRASRHGRARRRSAHGQFCPEAGHRAWHRSRQASRPHRRQADRAWSPRQQCAASA